MAPVTHDTSSNNNTDDKIWSPTDYFDKLEPPRQPTPYVTKVEAWAEGDARPDLKFLARELKRLRSVKDTKKGKVAVLKFPDSSASPEFPDANTGQLEEDLKKVGTDGVHRLYILEDISNEYVEIFCSQLPLLDPSFFARHLRVTRWESSSYASNAPPLPSSTIDGVQSFLLRYPELVVFPDLDGVIFLEDKSKRRRWYCDCNLYREITFTRVPDQDFKPDNIGIIRRKLSFWSWTRHNGIWVGEL